MPLLCSVLVITGFIIVAVVGVFSVLTDLLAMSEDGAVQRPPARRERDWGNDFGRADHKT